MIKFQFKHRKTGKKNFPSEIWDIRYALDLWDMSIPNENLKILGKLAQLNKNKYSLYIKYNKNFEQYNDKKTNDFLKTNNLLSKQQKNLSKLIKKIDRKIANQTKSKFTNKQINIIKKLYNSDKSYNKHKSGRLYRYTQKSKYNKNKKGRLYRYTRKSKHK
tara:strand:+ start:40 stop:522 length:483 start_codon:yes stop_codon:yes gene_type:complete